MAGSFTDALHVHDVAKRDLARLLTALTVYLNAETKRNRAALRTIEAEVNRRWFPEVAPLTRLGVTDELPLPVPQFGRGDLE